MKSDAGNMIFMAIERLLQDKPFFTSAVEEMLLKAYLNPADACDAGGTVPTELTPREREIVQLIAEGRSSKEIATALGISVKTAETHRASLMRKLGARNLADVVKYCIRNHLVGL